MILEAAISGKSRKVNIEAVDRGACVYEEGGMYEERSYQQWMASEGLVYSRAAVKESDLLIAAPHDVQERATALLCEARVTLERYIERDGRFQTTLTPHLILPDAPLLVRRMAASAERFSVGPMATVAGAVAEYVAEALVQQEDEVLVENGGDIAVASNRPVTFGLFAGEHSPFTQKVRFRVTAGRERYGVCTSSGTVGPSFSFGKADAVCIVAASAIDADAAASAYANQIQTKEDVARVVALAEGDTRILGIIAAKDDCLGIFGAVELI